MRNWLKALNAEEMKWRGEAGRLMILHAKVKIKSKNNKNDTSVLGENVQVALEGTNFLRTWWWRLWNELHTWYKVNIEDAQLLIFPFVFNCFHPHFYGFWIFFILLQYPPVWDYSYQVSFTTGLHAVSFLYCRWYWLNQHQYIWSKSFYLSASITGKICDLDKE